MNAGPKRAVLITRPAEEAGPLRAACAARGLTPVSCPMLSITLYPENVPDLRMAGTLVLTSRQAVRAIVAAGAVVPGLPVYAVGDKTAEAARQAGFAQVTAAAGTAEKLMEMLTDVDLQGPVRYLSAADVSAAITVPGQAVARHVVYRADMVELLTADARAALRDGTAEFAIFMSARTGTAFAKAVAQAGLAEALKATKALCLSDTVLQSVAHLPWQGKQVAAYPDREHLLALLEES